jgi:hypothetical protein
VRFIPLIFASIPLLWRFIPLLFRFSYLFCPLCLYYSSYNYLSTWHFCFLALAATSVSAFAPDVLLALQIMPCWADAYGQVTVSVPLLL